MEQASPAAPISVLILTKNEEQDLARCIDSVSWSDDVHVFDSESTDRTQALAVSLGAQLTVRPFDGYARQRNAALHGLEFRNPWVLILDADEVVPTPLRDELAAFVRTAPEHVDACRLQRRDFLFGRWLKHAQLSPYYIRLVRPARVRYEREVNEVLIVEGAIVDLEQPFDHFPFSKGMAHWFEKHNVYSTMEAREVLAVRSSGRASLKDCFDRDFNRRRRAQKNFFYRMPGRPLVKWLYMMLVRRAVLDGRAGVIYATLQAIYEYMIVVKTVELEQQARAASVRLPR